MSLCRASVKNTFLAFELVDQDHEPRSAERRTRSADAHRCSALPLNSTAECSPIAEQLSCLSSLSSGCSARIDALREDPFALKKVDSNLTISSMSTIAPDDWETSTLDGSEYKSSKVGLLHARVPKNVNLAEAAASRGTAKPPTTLMLRNLPNKYTQQELVEELSDLGLGGAIDFFYAPIDVGTMGNVGYAFVNFVDASWATRCQELVNGYVFEKFPKNAKRRAATVSEAHLQGLEANIQHYESAKVTRKARAMRSGPLVVRRTEERS